MYLCDRCQKGLQVGMNVSHSHRRTKKHALPNLHVLTVKIGGQGKTMRLCTKCTRIVRAQYPFSAEKVEVKAPVLEVSVKEPEVKVTVKKSKSKTLSEELAASIDKASKEKETVPSK